VSDQALVHCINHLFHISDFYALWSIPLRSAGSNPVVKSSSVTTTDRMASTSPSESREQAQGCVTPGAPPKPFPGPRWKHPGTHSIKEAAIQKRCKEYSKCLLCIKNTANKPYSSFHSNLNNIVQELEKSTKNSAVPTVTTVTSMPWVPLSLLATFLFTVGTTLDMV